MLSIRLDSIESSQIVSPGVDSLYRRSICARLKGAYHLSELTGRFGPCVNGMRQF